MQVKLQEVFMDFETKVIASTERGYSKICFA